MKVLAPASPRNRAAIAPAPDALPSNLFPPVRSAGRSAALLAGAVWLGLVGPHALGSPGVSTQPATDVTANSASLQGTVSPNAQATAWFFQYGPSAALGSATHATLIPAQSALQFNGVNQSGTINGLSLSNRSFTLEFWARREGLDRRDYILAQGTNVTRRGLHVGFRENNRFTFAFWSDDLDAPVGVSDNAWHHWACTYNLSNNQRIIYRDGVGVATNNAFGPYLGEGPVLLARMAQASFWFGGGVDEVRVWDHVRTAAQISANRSNLLSGAESGLLGYWRLDEGSGAAAADSSPANNPILLAGAPAWSAGIPHATQVAVNAPLAGLQGGTTYHFRLVASNSVGTAYGSTRTFTTPVSGLGVTTLPATGIGPNAATLNGGISPNGQATRWFFQYGLTPDYGGATPATILPAQSALRFDGSGSASAFVSLSNRSFSVEFWARRDGSNRWDVILGQGQGANRNGLHIGFRSNNRFTFGFWADDLDAPLALSDNDWHHWACTYNATNNQRIIYRDGVGVATNNAIGPFLGYGDFGGMLFVGRFEPISAQGNWYRGDLDEIRVWDHVRTEPQISGNRSNLLASGTPGLLAYWRLDEGGGMSSGDTSGNGRDLIFNYPITWHPGVPHTFDFPVSAALAGLYANTTYHFRLVGSNSAGQAFGLNQSFTTQPVPQLQTVVVPPNPIRGRQAKVWPAMVVFGQFFGFQEYNFGVFPHGDGFSRLAYTDGGAGYLLSGTTRVVSSGGVGAFFQAAAFSIPPSGRGPIGQMNLWSSGWNYTDDTTLVVEPPHVNDFQPALDNTNATTIQLQSGTYYQNAVIGRNVTIRGEGIGRTIVSGGLLGSVFRILPGATVTLEDMTIIDGLAPSGGGIFNDGNLTVNRCEIRDCRAYQYLGGEGGGIYNRGGAKLVVRDSIIRNNIAARDGGGISSSGFNFSRLPSPGGEGYATNLMSGTLEDYGSVQPPSNLNSTNALEATGEQFEDTTARRVSDYGAPREFFEGLFGDPFENPTAWLALGSPVCEIINTVIADNRVGNASAVATVRTPFGDIRLPRALCFGGGVHNDLGVLTIRDSVITNNIVASDLGNFGGGISSFIGALKVSNSRISHNQANSTTLLSSGGAIHSFACYTRISDSELNHNEVNALFLSSGGALKNTVASFTELTRTRVEHNKSGGGGGIANDYYGILQITDSTILTNRISGIISANGGGLRNEHAGQAVLTRSTISGNTIQGKAKGGGLYNECTQKTIAGVPIIIASTLTLRNCTVSGNVIDGEGTFGIPFPVLGAGLHTSADKYGIANTFLSSCTIVGNRATNGLLRVGGGLYGSSLSSFSTTLSNNIPGAALVQLANTIVAQNVPSDLALNPLGPALYTSLGYNLDSDATGPQVCLTDGLLAADARFRTSSNPLLGPLQNNGGPTPTHALLPGSPAIDRGSPEGFLNEELSPANDQRGLARALGGPRRDIGAFEATAPQATGEGYTTLEDLALTVPAHQGVLANDFATALQAVLVANATNGIVNLAADGAFTYVPDPDFNGPDVFTYVVRDASGVDSPPVAAAILVRPRLDLLASSPEPDTVAERNTPLTLTFDELVWAHHLRDHLRITGSQSGPRGFTVAAQSGNFSSGTSLTVNVDGDFTLGERVTVRVLGSLASMGGSPLFPEETFTFDIHANRPPVPAPPQTFSVAEDSVLEFAAPATLLNGAFDPDGQPLQVRTNQLALGSLADLAGRFPGLPQSAYEYVGNWPNGSWAARVPVFAQHGELELRADGTFTYRPDTNYHGPDFFDYTVTDGFLESVSARVNLVVTPVNDPPEPQPDYYGAGPLTIGAAEGVLANDFDVDGDLLRASLATPALHGTVNLSTNGAFTYTPGGGYPGWDVFTYLCSDGSATSAPVRVKLGNARPVAVRDAYFPTPGAVFTMTNLAQSLLVNDTDPDGDSPLTAALETPPAHGEVVVDPDGTFIYTPTNGYAGTDAFTYRANDGFEPSEPARVKLGNSLPVAVADSGYVVFGGQSLTVPAAQGVLANDTDADGDPLTAQLVSGPAHGVLSLQTSGAFTYTPTNASFTGNDTFTYRAVDPVTNSATVSVTIGVFDYLRVQQFSPARHSALGVSNGPVQMTFNSALDVATVAGRVTLHGSVTGRRNFTTNVTGATLTLTPVGAFRPGETVSVLVRAGMKGTGFFQLENDLLWQFTVRAPRGGAFFTQVTPGTNLLGPLSVAVGDFNGDGLMDAFLLSQSAPPLIAYNQGNRVFTNRVETLGLDWSSTLGSIRGVVADFNNDGLPDLAATTGWPGANRVAVGLNNGGGGFTPFILPPAHGGFAFMAAGDFNGDGLVDLVAVSGSLVWTYLNNGDGSFTVGPATGLFPPSPYNFSRDLAVGDMDGDGDLDVYVAGFAGDSLLLNDGTGRFTRREAALDDLPKDAVRLADLDGDGDLDVLLGPWSSRAGRVWLNDGQGNFTRSSYQIAGGNAYSFAVADLDGDGDFDTFHAGSGTGISLNDGSGRLTPTTQSLPYAFSAGNAVADFDNDGDLDIFVLRGQSTSLTTQEVWYNQTPPRALDDLYAANGSSPVVIPAATGVLANDLAGDGGPIISLLVSNGLRGTVSLSTNGAFTYTPGGSFTGADVFLYRAADSAMTSAVARVKIGNTAPIAVADTNYLAVSGSELRVPAPGVLGNDTDAEHDPLTALLVAAPTNGAVLLRGNGSFAYQAHAGYVGLDHFTYRATDGFATSAVVLVRIDVRASLRVLAMTPPPNTPRGGAAEDIVLRFNRSLNAATVPTNVLVEGGFSGPRAVTRTVTGDTLRVDPAADFAPGEVVTLTLRETLEGTGGERQAAPGVFQYRVEAPLGLGEFSDSGQRLGSNVVRSVVFADIDGDGDLDAITGHGPLVDSGGIIPGSAAAWVWRNNGNGTFTDSGQRLADYAGNSAAAADLDRDGDVDVVLGDHVWWNNGTGIFTEGPALLPPGGSSVVADFNGDGWPDIAVHSLATLNIYTNNRAGGFGLSPASTANLNFVNLRLYRLATGDLDGDGSMDLFGVQLFDSDPCRVWLNDGHGVFRESGQVFGAGADALVLVDVDGDGDLDAVAPRGSTTAFGPARFVYFNSGDGTFTTSSQVASTNSVVGAGMADLNGDGFPDLVLLQRHPTNNLNTSTILWNDGAGTFTPSGLLLGDSTTDPTNSARGYVLNRTLAIGDLNGDGAPDLYIGVDRFGLAWADQVWFNQAVLAPLDGGLALTIPDTATAQPFTNLLVRGPASVTLSVRVDNIAKGGFTPASLATGGFTGPVGGVYSRAAGTPASAQAALRQLVFAPTPNRVPVGSNEVTAFTLIANSGSVWRTNDLSTVTSISVNDPPLAVNDSGPGFTGSASGSFVTASVLANDSDPDPGDALTLINVNPTGMQGTLTNLGNGTFRYTPPASFLALPAGVTVTERFTYTIRDPQGATASATVTLTINGENAPPVAVGDSLRFLKHAGQQLLTATLLANDFDPDAGETAMLTISAVNTNGTRGRVLFDPLAGVSYDPTGGFTNLADGVANTDSFTYTIRDPQGATSTATVNLVIMGADDPPVAGPDTLTILEKAAPTNLTAHLLANDFDPNPGQTALLGIVAINASNTIGLVTLSNGVVTYDPAGRFDSLAAGQTTSDTFRYSIRVPNVATIAHQSVPLQLLIRSNFLDVRIEVTPEGLFSLGYDGRTIYTNLPLPEFAPVTGARFALGARTGGQFQTHEVDDLGLSFVTAEPVAVNYDFATNAPAGSTLLGSAAVTEGILRLTTASGNQTGTFILPDLVPTNGVAGFVATFKVRMANGSALPADGFSFVWGGNLPATAFGEEGAGYGLVVSFDTYNNGNQEAPAIDVRWRSRSAETTMTLTIVGENDPPQPGADFVVLNEGDGPANLTARLRANDTDPDAGETATLEITAVSGVTSNGIVTLANGQVTYTPYANANLRVGDIAEDGFTYTVRDAQNASALAPVTVFIVGTNATFLLSGNLAIQPGLNADAILSLPATPRQMFTLESSTNLVDWVFHANVFAPTNGLAEFIERNLTHPPLRFYRARDVGAMPPGLINAWRADGDFLDRFGPLHATPTNGLGFTDGVFGGAFNFTGGGERLVIGAPALPVPWTAAMWVKRQDTFDASAALLTDTTYALKLEQYQANRRVGITRYGVNDPAFSYTAPTNQWVHLVFVGTAAGTQLYVNGVFVDSMSFNIPLPIGTLSRPGTGDRLRAAVDDLLIFNRALTAPEIRALHETPRP